MGESTVKLCYEQGVSKVQWAKTLSSPGLWQVEKGARLYWNLCGSIHVKRLHSGVLQRVWVNCKERRHFTETEVWPFVFPDPKVLSDTKGDPSTDSAATNACCEWVYLRSSDNKEWPEVLVSSPCFLGIAKEGVLRAAQHRGGDEGARKLFLVEAFP